MLLFLQVRIGNIFHGRKQIAAKSNADDGDDERQELLIYIRACVYPESFSYDFINPIYFLSLGHPG